MQFVAINMAGRTLSIYKLFVCSPRSSISTMTRRNRRNSICTTTRHIVRFAGRSLEATVTNDAGAADDWVESVLSHADGPMIVGLDCEWRPNFVRGRRENSVAVLQLCAGDSCLVLQLRHMAGGAPDGVKSFLEGNDATFVGVGVEKDIGKLRGDYGIHCCNYEDVEEPCWEYLMVMGSYLGLRRRSLGLKGYASELLGIHMEKPRWITMSDWEVRTLSEEQIEYACIDAYVSYALGCEVSDYFV